MLARAPAGGGGPRPAVVAESHRGRAGNRHRQPPTSTWWALVTLLYPAWCSKGANGGRGQRDRCWRGAVPAALTTCGVGLYKAPQAGPGDFRTPDRLRKTRPSWALRRSGPVAAAGDGGKRRRRRSMAACTPLLAAGAGDRRRRAPVARWGGKGSSLTLRRPLPAPIRDPTALGGTGRRGPRGVVHRGRRCPASLPRTPSSLYKDLPLQLMRTSPVDVS